MFRWRKNRRHVIVESDEAGDITQCQRRVDLNPTDSLARMRLAAALHAAGSLEEAHAAYAAAVEILSATPEPDNQDARLAFLALAHYMEGDVLDALGREVEARHHWEKCVSIYAAITPNQSDLATNEYYVWAKSKLI